MDESPLFHDQLLATKFFIPSSSHALIPRSRLLELLNRSLEYPLTLDPTNFALSLMHKDFSLVLSQAYDVSVSMPATAAAQQMYTAAMAKGMDADFSIMIQFMEKLAALSTIQKS